VTEATEVEFRRATYRSLVEMNPVAGRRRKFRNFFAQFDWDRFNSILRAKTTASRTVQYSWALLIYRMCTYYTVRVRTVYIYIYIQYL